RTRVEIPRLRAIRRTDHRVDPDDDELFWFRRGHRIDRGQTAGPQIVQLCRSRRGQFRYQQRRMRAYGGGDEHDVRLSHRGADPPEANIPGADTEDLGSTTRARRGRIADVIDPVDAL